MTLAGKKNHHHEVKLLRGYGCSVRLKGSKAVLGHLADDSLGLDALADRLEQISVGCVRIVLLLVGK